MNPADAESIRSRTLRALSNNRTPGYNFPGYFLDFDLKRDALARYGLSVDEAQMAVTSAIGGEPVTTTIERPLSVVC